MPLKATVKLQGYRLPLKYRILCSLVNLAFWRGVRVKYKVTSDGSLLEAVISEGQLERFAKYFNLLINDMISKKSFRKA